MKNLKIIIGLGNPITKYKNTRHNAGIWYLHMLSKIYNKKFKKINKFNGYVSEILFFNKKVFLFVPDVYMNLNFLPIYKISSFYNITLNEMLIIHDELDLQPGVIKLKNGYGSNGHKGLKGIIQKFKKKNFYKRLSIGIGRPDNVHEISNYVLSKPTSHEREKIFQAIKKSILSIFF
ncbi:aminoacyl-tRNA hydrolase [Buchnera aphidicola]|uniref:aminoacyl-tRNA hydrolase n=1 Tax=Buchnera aphidicola TaxID=9 RepID=UPI0020933593|nr:aminoacyl-tRNA hydrolase [Buchnera aphidicola]USS94263.1 aminoacyl-tRNA hydrolase [Buchnera aphidicola (Sipha maydis)]WII23813.1 aminoacyl-tRNA hydrolase [Buchnera aphidicola (Sipha maydis)]